jgi:outer membrane protein assembly factor BamB
MYGFSFSGGAFNTTPLFATTNTYNTHGLMMAGSSNGASGNIVWGLSPNGNNYSTAFPATLRAINATTGAELWNSGTKASDNLTNTAKFITPLIANGRVYVGEQNAVAVFGILNSSALRGQATARGKASIH